MNKYMDSVCRIKQDILTSAVFSHFLRFKRLFNLKCNQYFQPQVRILTLTLLLTLLLTY